MQIDPSGLDFSQVTYAKPYHGPAAHSYSELMSWNANHMHNGMSTSLVLVFIAVFCLIICLFGIYDWLWKDK